MARSIGRHEQRRKYAYGRSFNCILSVSSLMDGIMHVYDWYLNIVVKQHQLKR